MIDYFLILIFIENLIIILYSLKKSSMNSREMLNLNLYISIYNSLILVIDIDYD